MPSCTPSCVCGTCKRCRLRLAQRRYRATAKGKAANHRYRQSPKGKAYVAKLNAKRIIVGSRVHGYAKTVDHAAQINAHIKERVYAFKQRQQSGTQAEGDSSGTV